MRDVLFMNIHGVPRWSARPSWSMDSSVDPLDLRIYVEHTCDRSNICNSWHDTITDFTFDRQGRLYVLHAYKTSQERVAETFQ